MQSISSDTKQDIKKLFRLVVSTPWHKCNEIYEAYIHLFNSAKTKRFLLEREIRNNKSIKSLSIFKYSEDLNGMQQIFLYNYDRYDVGIKKIDYDSRYIKVALKRSLLFLMFEDEIKKICKFSSILSSELSSIPLGNKCCIKIKDNDISIFEFLVFPRKLEKDEVIINFHTNLTSNFKIQFFYSNLPSLNWNKIVRRIKKEIVFGD